jgi:soluble lytic murein transglycosylase-like protein
VFLYKPSKAEDQCPVSFSCNLRTLVAFGVVACFSSIQACAQTLNIFSSTDAQGHTRWSTQAFDSSYKPVHNLSLQSTNRDSSTSEQPRITGRYSAMAKRRQQWQPTINSAANSHGVDARWITALIEIESGFNPNAISPKGAIGLMQLMPNTATRYGMRDAKELFNPERNLDIGIRHLKDLLNTHDGNVALALASYNAGSGAVAKSGQRIPRFNETMLYVPAVLAAIASSSVTEKP